jgi:hypothetical protein
LFLLPTGRPGRCFMDMDDEATVEGSSDLFLLSRGQLRPYFFIFAPVFKCAPLASTMEDKCLVRKP